MLRATGVHPNNGLGQGVTRLINRYRARPLGCAAHGSDFFPKVRVPRQEQVRRLFDNLPPNVGILLRATIRQQDYGR
jgi:hypothetical protein